MPWATRRTTASSHALIEEAVGLAQAADVAVLHIGLPSYKESEGYDRADMDLTAQQIALIKAVSAVQPNCVVVLNNGSPVAMATGSTVSAPWSRRG